MDEIGQMSEAYKLLGDRSRLTILALLKERELCVCEIVDIMEMSQPNVSQHMRKLKAAGLVNESKRGQWVYYSLNSEDKPHIQAALGFVPPVKDKLEKLKSGGSCC